MQLCITQRYLLTRGVRIVALVECGIIVHLNEPEHQGRLVYFLADLLRPRRGAMRLVRKRNLSCSSSMMDIFA
jgi:hypothetical protein